ncbi:type II secretion system protein GspD [Deinococcus sp. SL84]|uniref:type II secretion system protein GspD n=1 Tax=Deinococcus sp. SL84 TaxID=2994663 RepID=UPI0022741393|nr:secretin N-terminal domain-containing protein [Deinococcus sp. SL84]MCY1701968.1 secretin [Deinococcus sp. SL84]
MKYATALFVTAALGLGAAQTAPVSSAPAAAQTQSAASDPALSRANITIETGRYQGPLSGLLGAIAKSAGYELVLEVNVDTLAAEGEQARPVAYSFRDKPFNEVWPLLMDVYGLNYEIVRLGDQEVIRVNNTLVQRVVDLEAADPNYVVERAKVFFGSVIARQENQSSTNQNTQGNTQSGTGTANTSSNSTGSGNGTQLTYNNVFETETLKVVADNVGKKVIIRGNNKEVRDVERFVRSIDQAAVSQRNEQLSKYGDIVNSTKREIYIANGNAAGIRDFITGQYPALRVVALPNNAGLLIEGNTAVVDDALALLRQVDPMPGETTQRVFQLVNANADEVAKTLTATLARDAADNTTTTAGNTAGPTAITATTTANNATNTGSTGTITAPSTAATILPDARTNTLIVRGTPTQVAQIAELIPTLDRKVPQINLQVRIQEINEEATKTLGVNWRVTAGGFNVGILPSGLTASFNPLQTVTGFNIFPALNALESQRVAKRVYDGTVSMQSGQGSLNAGTGSQDASSTAAASIRSGGRLELNIIGAEGSNIEKTIPYGVVLDFFEPSVAPDGTITLRVRGQINELRNREALNAALASGGAPSLLDFLNSDAQTKISFKSGETVLLAGLMAENNSTTKSGLPFLSQIPGLGALAGEQSTTNNGTQMLFVITGDIIE